VSVIVPLMNELDTIAGKLADIARLDPAPAQVILVDGGSSDGSVEIAARAASAAGWRLVRSAVAGKTAQLNAALAHATSDWVLVTDADALLPADAIEALRAAAHAHGAAVAGMPVVPLAAHPLERLHWELANALRVSEHDRGSSGLVVGPCYMFARDLFDRFPDDVVADDVYVSLAALTADRPIALAAADVVVETRSPRTLRGLIAHKLRKADAYLHEVRRFAFAAPRTPAARRPFVWRALMVSGVPTLIGFVAFCVMHAAIAAEAPAAAALLVATEAWLAVWGTRAGAPRPLGVIALYALLGGVAAAALVMRPFTRRTDRLARIAVSAAAFGEDS
jgi:glycosyltransferase involved in cell wall biosynthesis